MNTAFLITAIALSYLSINFLLALAFHIHGEHQAHLRLRFLDILVHFVLMTAFAIPLLLFMTFEALFGGEKRNTPPSSAKTPPVSHAGARAA